MILHKGQVFRFLGRNGLARAKAAEKELQGACTRAANQLQMTETRVAHFGRPGMANGHQPAATGPRVTLEKADYFGDIRHRTIGLGRNGR